MPPPINTHRTNPPRRPAAPPAAQPTGAAGNANANAAAPGNAEPANAAGPQPDNRGFIQRRIDRRRMDALYAEAMRNIHPEPPPSRMPATGAWRAAVDAWVRATIFNRAELFGREWAQREMLFQNRLHQEHPIRNRVLQLGACHLRRLPPMYPAWVLQLNVSHNRLGSLNSLPARLETLNADHSELRRLPNSLPVGLRELSVANNQLTALPRNLPRGLRTLDASHNALTACPENLPRLLGTLNLSNNRIENLSDEALRAIAGMSNSWSNIVDLRDNPLSPQAHARLSQLLSQANYSGPDVRYPGIQETYRSQWSQWRSDTILSEHGVYEAERQLVAWLRASLPALQAGENVPPLALSGLRLSSLPPLPEGLTELDITNNHFTRLPENLPRSLNLLRANGNQLTTLPDAYLSNRALTIFITDNPLSPRTTRSLDELRHSRRHNGAVVHYTRLHDGQSQERVLRPAPAAVAAAQAAPAGRAPARRQPESRRLEAVGAPAQARPHQLPVAPARATAAVPPQPDVADDVQPAPPRRDADIEAAINALPVEVAAELRNMARAAEAAGNPISPEQLLVMAFEVMTVEAAQAQAIQAPPQAQAIQAAPQAVPADASELAQAAAAWAPPPQTNIAATTRLWRTFANEPGAAEFAQFLNRLRQTVNVNDPTFQRSVVRWMTQLEGNPALRRDTFAISIGATESCQDRISLTYNAMRKLSMAADVSRGSYDQRLPDLITLARGVFRLEQLEQIARETTAALVRTHGANRVDEIEVYLGYQVMLREPLALPVDTANMAFFLCSRLTQDDLNRAQARVLAAEQREFANYLSTDFAPWQEVMERLAPELHEQAQDRLIEAMGDEFMNRLNTQLQAMGLQGDADAERTLGPQVQAEIAREIHGQLTRDFLASQGLLDLLNPPAHPANNP